jgi:hypothetical protein
MSAATQPRNTAERPGYPLDQELPIKSGVTLFPGCMANVDANGALTDAADTASERCAGNVQAVNPTTGKAIIRRGIHKYANGDGFTAADLGLPVMVKDNQTVEKEASSTNKVVAGKLVALDSDGVWVDHAFAGAEVIRVEVEVLADPPPSP